MAKQKATKSKSPNNGHALVIVESPAKAKTIGKFLGSGYTVEASIGHVRDLPQGAKQIPAQYKGEPWSNLGVDVDHDFAPIYIVPPGKSKQIKLLKDQLKKADALYLATDEDREGEAISWHLLEILKPKVPVHRLVFHEITKDAIQAALASPRDVDNQLVRAQETRRILDRLFGYEVSPLLWRKVRPKLSAGRVQSVAVRLIVERERDRMAFVSATWWDLLAKFAKSSGQQLDAALVSVDGRRIPAGKDFDSTTGKLKNPQMMLLDAETSAALAERIRSGEFTVTKVEDKPYTTKPYAPFTTSTLQQEANRKLGYTARRTMQVAQSLYENGHITYMRTDSTNLAAVAIEDARRLVKDQYGDQYPAGRGPRVSLEGQERAGGPRSDSPGRPSVRVARNAAWAARRRRVQTVRADLEADDRQPDGRLQSPANFGPDRRRRLRLPGERQDDRLPRLSAGLCRRQRRSGRGTRRPGEGAAERRGRRIGQMHRDELEGPHDPAARSLQRSGADQGARRARYRPAEYVRFDYRHDPRAELCVQKGRRVGADLGRVLRRASCWKSISPA